MSRRRAPIAVVGLLLTHAAHAAEEAHAQEGGVSSMWPLLFSTINLLIFVWILGRFVMPGIRAWVRERRVRVINELQEAAAARAAAERLRVEWEARLAQLDQTIAEMRAQARQDADHERERILAAASKTAETIRRDAERAAAYEVRRTQEQLRAELVRQAVRLAEDAARKDWTAAHQQRFVAEFLKQVQS